MEQPPARVTAAQLHLTFILPSSLELQNQNSRALSLAAVIVNNDEIGVALASAAHVFGRMHMLPASQRRRLQLLPKALVAPPAVTWANALKI